MSIFNLYFNVVGDYRDFVRSFFSVADDHAREFIERDELRYILAPANVRGPDFPGVTFRVLEEKELAKYGEYRTRRLVLQAWDKLAATAYA